jgi:hypothetical protein
MGSRENTIYGLDQRSTDGFSRYLIHPAWSSLDPLSRMVSRGREEDCGWKL